MGGITGWDAHWTALLRPRHTQRNARVSRDDAAPGPRRPPQRQAGKATGAWAVGHLTPLNGNEQFKKDDDGLNVRPASRTSTPRRASPPSRPTTCADGCAGGGSTPSASPASTAARPRRLEPHELDDEYFMLRVRIDGGALTTEQLRAIAEISQEFAPRHRRHHRPAEHPAALDPRRGRPGDLAAARGRRADHHRGLRRHPARHPRLARSPASPRTRSSTARPAVDEIHRALHRQPGVLQPAAQVQDRDLRLAAARRRARDQRHRVRRRRATPSTAPASTCGSAAGCPPTRCSAQRLGAWVPLDEVPDVWAGVVGDLPRLRLPPAAQPRPAEVPGRRLGPREVPPGAGGRVPQAHAGRRPGARSRRRRTGATTSACTAQKDGRFYVGVAPASAASTAPRCTNIADLAEAHGSGRVATTVEQKMLVLDVAQDQVESLVAGLEALGLPASPSAFRRGTMACTGIEFCKLAIVETKARARTVDRRAGAPAARVRRADHHQRQRLPELLRPHPGRRHRPQGQLVLRTPTATRSRATRCTSAAGSA